ncbi:MAG: NADH-quinone oxidoreductase subunit NuoE [Paracoccaceae bacterium]
MLRRLNAHQPATFAFTPANEAWARAQITKYPPGRQASAIIPLLWRAQEQEGWLSKPAIEHVADMLSLAYIRALEVATFYFMFHLQPVGDVAHVQVCGTTSCMIMGAEDLIAVCKRKIAGHAHERSVDGKFSWEEVECLGACANAPMAQIGKDYYEDLTPARLEAILDEFAAGKVPVPGPQNGRYSCEPATGLTSLKEFESGRTQWNGSVQRAVDIKDTVKRIDGREEALTTPWLGVAAALPKAARAKAAKERPAPAAPAAPRAPAEAAKPAGLKAARGGKADDLKIIKGMGPKLEALCHKLGYFHFDQIAAWTAAEVAWVDENLEGFRGRVTRDGWVAQAKVLAASGTV